MTTHDNLRRWPILFSLMALLALCESRADEWYMKIDGVPGELTEGRFAGWTPIRSVSPLGTNDGLGAASFSCEIRKPFDRTTPVLLQHCGQGESIRRITLAYILTQPQAALYRVTLDGVLVSSIAQAGSKTAPATPEYEEVAFNFSKIEWACFELDPNNGGTLGGLTAIIDQSTGQSRLKTRPPFRAVVAWQEETPGVLVTWPAEEGHTYRILSSAGLGQPWNPLLEMTATQDGSLSQFVPLQVPALFMRVEEAD